MTNWFPPLRRRALSGSHRWKKGLGSADIIPGIERGALDPTIVSRLRCMNATLSGFRNPNSEIALAAAS
jgi:hypothetical protein